MHVACPHCRNPIEVVDAAPLGEVLCPSCGSSFRLEQGPTVAQTVDTGPQKLGKFLLMETLGMGAFGTVYKARDPELDRTVAIKVPRTGNVGSGQHLDRFLREARSVAQLRHPSIVPVHEVGEWRAEGVSPPVPYLVSEFVEGVTLADYITAKRLTFRESAELVAQLADALQHAHDQGVIHRDVKPSNIMLQSGVRGQGSGVNKEGDLKVASLTPDSCLLTPRLMDFGLAKRDAAEITMTVEGQILGTPAYMSPEQARGEAHKVDAKSDVYSLGVILYELLTGEIPFRGNTRMLLHQVLHDEPRPPRSLNDRIPRDLDTICLKALAKEPGRRFQTAGDLAADLRRFLKGEPITARPVGRIERGWRWCRRNPVVAGLTAAVFVAMAIGTVVSLFFALDALAERDRADKKAEEADEKAQEVERETMNARRNLYRGSMYLAGIAVQDGKADIAREFLQRLEPENTGGIDVRGFEWHYLNRELHNELRTLRGHTSGVASVAFSPDGRWLASASYDGTVRIWDAGSGQEIRRLLAPPERLNRVAFSPDGRLLAARGLFSTVEVWDAGTWEKLRTLRLPDGGFSSGYADLAFSPDSLQLLESHGDSAGIWDVKSGREVRSINAGDEVGRVAFSPDGRWFALGVFEKGVRLYETRNGQLVRTMSGQWAAHIAFTPDGRSLAIAETSGRGTLTGWDVHSGKKLYEREVPGNCVAFSPDGRRLAVASGNRTVSLWNVASGKQVRTFRGHGREVESVAFSPDGGRLASASRDGTIKLWNTGGHQELRTFRLESFGSPMAFSPDGRWVAERSYRDAVAVELLGVDSPPEMRDSRGQRDVIAMMAVDGRRLAFVGFDTVKFANAAHVRTLGGYTSNHSTAAFSPDGRWLASASSVKENITIWDTASDQERKTLRGHSTGVITVVFSPDGRWLASGGHDNAVKLWDAGSGQEIRILHGHTDRVEGVAFSHDSRWLASCSQDSTVKLWDVDIGKELFTLRGHTWVHGTAWSPDNRRLVSAGDVVKLWDTASGQELLSLKPDIGVRSIAFSPDGQRLAIAGIETSPNIRGYDWRAIVLDGRPLTAEEQADFEPRALVEFLVNLPLQKADVQETIRAYPGITEMVRQRALAITDRHEEQRNPARYASAARAVARLPFSTPQCYHLALRQAETACRLAPHEATHVTTLGMAQHRVGRYRDAVDTLMRAQRLNEMRRCARELGFVLTNPLLIALTRSEYPPDLAFLAMAHHQLGQKGEAQAALARLRDSAQNPRWAKNEETQAFLREAETLIEGKPRNE